jgi:hypothetical protein
VLLSLLKTIEASGDADPASSKSVEDFVAREDRLTRLVKIFRALVHAKSDRSGSFKIDIPGSVESVAAFGYAESVD